MGQLSNYAELNFLPQSESAADPDWRVVCPGGQLVHDSADC